MLALLKSLSLINFSRFSSMGEDLVSLFMRDDAEKEAEDEVHLVNERPRIFLLSGTV